MEELTRQFLDRLKENGMPKCEKGHDLTPHLCGERLESIKGEITPDEWILLINSAIHQNSSYGLTYKCTAKEKPHE